MKKAWLFLIPSIILYIIAPDHYDWNYCAICCLVFLTGVIFTIVPEIKKGVYFSFNTIFFFSYFWTSFAYPVLVYGTRTDRDNIINKALDWNLLSHTSALALLFISCYIIGFSSNKESFRRLNPHKLENAHLQVMRLSVPYSLFTISFVIYIALAIWGFLTDGNINMTKGQFVTDIYFTLFAICLFVNVYNNRHNQNRTFPVFLKTNKYLIISSVLVFTVFIIFGDRMPAIRTILMVFAVYYFFWNKIKIRRLLLVGLCLLLLLFFVRQTRGTGRDFASGNVTMATVEEAFDLENGLLYMFADLFFINRELCLGYEYAQTHELYYPQRILLVPLHPFPILPTIVSNALWGVKPVDMDTGAKLNGVLDINYDIEGHLGKHPAGDLLMSFGIIGMLLVAFFLGRVVGYIQTNCYSNIYMGICYIALMGWSLYLARADSLVLIRPLGYAILFCYFIYRIPTKKRRIRKI